MSVPPPFSASAPSPTPSAPSSEDKKKNQNNQKALEVGLVVMSLTFMYILLTNPGPIRLLLCCALTGVLAWYYHTLQVQINQNKNTPSSFPPPPVAPPPPTAPLPESLGDKKVTFQGNSLNTFDVPVCELITKRSGGSGIDWGCHNFDDEIYQGKLKREKHCALQSITNIPKGVTVQKWALQGSFGDHDCRNEGSWLNHSRWQIDDTYISPGDGSLSGNGDQPCALRFELDPNVNVYCPGPNGQHWKPS